MRYLKALGFRNLVCWGKGGKGGYSLFKMSYGSGGRYWKTGSNACFDVDGPVHMAIRDRVLYLICFEVACVMDAFMLFTDIHSIEKTLVQSSSSSFPNSSTRIRISPRTQSVKGRTCSLWKSAHLDCSDLEHTRQYNRSPSSMTSKSMVEAG